MIDLFVLLTPFLLLGVVALLGFAGCGFTNGEAGSMDSLTVSPSSGPTTGNVTVTITAVDTSQTPPQPVNVFGSNAMAAFDGVPPVAASITTQSAVTAVTPAVPNPGLADVTVSFDYPGGTTKGSIEQNDVFSYYLPVKPLQAVVTNVGANSTSASASLGSFPTPNKLVVVTVQWGGGAGNLTLSSSPSVTFTSIEADALTGPMGQVATYYAFVDLSAGLTVTATLQTATAITDLSVLVSAYDDVDMGGPVLPTSKQNKFATAPTLQFDVSSLAPGDLTYAVAIERGGAGASKGAWSPGVGFTAFVGQGNFIMLEYDVLQQTDITAGQVNVTATDASAPAAAFWYLFAMALKHA